MSSPTPDVPSLNGKAPADLPPVTPPSARFIAQLFFIPFGIVAVIVVLYLVINGMVHWLVGGPSNPDQLLLNLDSENPEVRWRAANDLAQVLLRDDRLASEPRSALQLTERLGRQFERNREREKELTGLTGDEATRKRKALEPEQHYLQYLSACVGNLTVPTALPLLEEMALDTSGDAESAALRQRQAAWALANLGQHLSRFDRLSEERRQAVLDELEQLSSDSPGAARAHAVLANRAAGRLGLFGLDETFEKCAGHDRPEVRQMVAFALTFWSGNAAENKRLEATLARLAADDGHGTVEEPELKGRLVRYNATRALARRGSDRVRLSVLEEMLDEEHLRRSFWVAKPTGVKDRSGGEEVIQYTREKDEVMVGTTLLTTLRALGELHGRNPSFDLTPLRPRVEALAEHANSAVRGEAQKLLTSLDVK